MPDGGDADVLEIVGSQLGQDACVNLVVPERLLIALQPQLPQPTRDIHEPSPMGMVIAGQKLPE